MKKKVTLRELVGFQIIYAIMLVSYYWMWARTDWKNWYETLQQVLGIFLLVIFIVTAMRIRKYKKESVDELAKQNLQRCDAFCLKFFVVVMVITAFICAIMNHARNVNGAVIGWIIVLSILVLSVVRTIAFTIMDKKGI